MRRACMSRLQSTKPRAKKGERHVADRMVEAGDLVPAQTFPVSAAAVPELPDVEENEGEIISPSEIQDRMLHNRRHSCPECDAFPPVCTQKARDFASFRCRSCGHTWTEGGI